MLVSSPGEPSIHTGCFTQGERSQGPCQWPMEPRPGELGPAALPPNSLSRHLCRGRGGIAGRNRTAAGTWSTRRSCLCSRAGAARPSPVFLPLPAPQCLARGDPRRRPRHRASPWLSAMALWGLKELNGNLMCGPHSWGSSFSWSGAMVPQTIAILIRPCLGIAVLDSRI